MVQRPHNHRRRFLVNLFKLSLNGILLGILEVPMAFAQELKLIDIGKKKRKDPANDGAVTQALGLGYVKNAKAKLKHIKKNGAERPDAKGKVIKFADQKCGNCQFYDDKGQKKGEGKCILIAQALIHEAGWCKSWVHKT